MDIRRIIIFAGLALSSYMLFYTWEQDYGSSAKKQAEAPATVMTEMPSDTPNVTNASVISADNDAPDVTNVNEQPVLPAADGEVSAVADKLVRVETDTLNMVIDLKGGQIIDARLRQYSESLDNPDVPFALLETSQVRQYIAQSGVLGPDGIDKNGGALYTAQQSEYRLGDRDQMEVVLTTETDKALVKKVFTFERGKYLTDVSYRVTNRSDQPWRGVFYAQLKRDASDDPSKTNSLGMAAYLGAALTTRDERYLKVTFDDLEDEPFKSVEVGGWAAILQHYFVAAWIPPQDQQHTYNGRYVNGNYIFGYYDNAVTVMPGETAILGAQLYTGPKIQDRLEEIADNLNLVVDYGILWWLAQPLFWVLDWLHSMVGNWGVAIILLTLLIKMVFFKLSAMSMRSMANMRKVAPKIQAIKDRHGDNREKLSQEMMKLYKTEKINPVAGCLPMLIQMPVFIALYWVLSESVELRQAPFFLWITDLSLKDPYFILPLLMGLSMFVQFKFQPTPPDPMQARVLQMMPFMMTIFFLWFPAGLVLYWVVNNIITIAQQYVINKQIEKSS